MDKVVLDASVIVKWFTKEENWELAANVFRSLRQGEIQIFLPELLKYELGNSLLRGKKLSFSSAKNILQKFYALPLSFAPEDRESAQETYLLAEKLEITYYDACYLTLARRLNASLVTDNPKHQRKAQNIKVTPLEKYR